MVTQSGEEERDDGQRGLYIVLPEIPTFVFENSMNLAEKPEHFVDGNPYPLPPHRIFTKVMYAPGFNKQILHVGLKIHFEKE